MTPENALKIIESGQLKNGNWESYVFAWSKQPTKKQASIAGIGSMQKQLLNLRQMYHLCLIQVIEESQYQK